MCGIAGIIDFRGVNPSDLKKMADIMRHRGPDDEGFVFINPASGEKLFASGKDSIPETRNLPLISDLPFASECSMGLLHRRLSIIDLSAKGHQPMTFQNDRFVIVLNGEIYNYLEIKSELEKSGVTFNSDSDTEVVVASYSKWGKECVTRFIGMWAFAIYDSEEKNLFLSRDRFGIKPLYYVQQEHKFAFASEIKALLELDFVSHKADLKSCTEYFYFGTSSDYTGTLFSEIKTLVPAQNAIYDLKNNKLKKFIYYNLSEKVKNFHLNENESELIEQYRGKFCESVELHLRSDVPVGSCLSGGLDSSSIVAFAAPRVKNNIFRTFTASYPGNRVDETNFAKLVSGSYNNVESYYCFPDIKEYWTDLEKMIWHQDLPIASTSMYAQWEVMKLAANHKMKVLLDGQGSDEVLGGYYIFAGMYLVEILKKLQIRRFWIERQKLKMNFTKHVNQDLARALFYFLPRNIQVYIRNRNRIGKEFIAPEFRNLVNKNELNELGGKNYVDLSLSSIAYTLQDLLRYEDRNSMAFSIESRVPFLDHRLVEFSLALDNGIKLKNGYTKYILRKSSEPFLNPEVIWRKEKFGFLTPQEDWKNQFKKELFDYLINYSYPGFLNKEFIINSSQKKISGDTPMSEFWKMFSFLKWVECFKIQF